MTIPHEDLHQGFSTYNPPICFLWPIYIFRCSSCSAMSVTHVGNLHYWGSVLCKILNSWFPLLEHIVTQQWEDRSLGHCCATMTQDHVSARMVEGATFLLDCIRVWTPKGATLTSYHISVTVTYMMCHEEHLWNVSVF